MVRPVRCRGKAVALGMVVSWAAKIIGRRGSGRQGRWRRSKRKPCAKAPCPPCAAVYGPLVQHRGVSRRREDRFDFESAPPGVGLGILLRPVARINSGKAVVPGEGAVVKLG